MTTSSIPADVDLQLAHFASCVEPLGATIKRFGGSEEAAAYITSVAHELAQPAIVVASDFASSATALVAALTASGLTCAVPATLADTRDQPLGISLATLAVVETGSVMLAERTLEDRGVGLLSITHITVVRTGDLVPSLAEAATALREVALRPGGGYGALVTGPSRTADIEMSLTVGVQGPARVYIVFVDDLN